jgi:hypothetical protein
MPQDITGFEIIPMARTPHGDLLIDRGFNGLVTLSMRRYGEDVASELVPVGTAVGPYSFFSARQDLPAGSVFFDVTLGEKGSYWRCSVDDNGLATWVPDRNFYLIRVQGSVTTPAASITNTVGNTPNWTHFGAVFPQPSGLFPAGLFPIGRRLRGTMRVSRVSGVGATTSKTELRIAGVAVVSVPWVANETVQDIQFEMWVTGANVVTVASVIVESWNNAGPAVYTARSIVDTDVTVTGIATAAVGVEFGIEETAVQLGLFKVVEASLEVVA